jgi:hypothetical protein
MFLSVPCHVQGTYPIFRHTQKSYQVGSCYTVSHEYPIKPNFYPMKTILYVATDWLILCLSIYIWYTLRNHLANPIGGCSTFRRLVKISSGLTRLWRSRAARIHFFNGVHVHHAAVGFITCRDFLIYGAKQKGKALWQTVWPSKHLSSLLPFLRGIWTWNI